MKSFLSSEKEVLQSFFWEEFTRALSEISSYEERIRIGLSGGSSFDIFYESFQKRGGEIPRYIREKIRFVFLDERIVSSDNPDRNERQLREKFLTSLLRAGYISEEQIISVDTGVSDIAGEYSMRVPHIDIGFFGVGPDGHIASLFPRHRLLRSLYGGFLEITDSPKLPLHRVTISPMMIRKIQCVFIACMKGKEEVYARFLDESISIEECPAKLLKGATSLILMGDIEI